MKIAPVCAVLCIALSAPMLCGATELASAPPWGSAKLPTVTIGSDAARARRMHRNLKAPFPSAPLFVADPALNAIVVYDSTLTGSVAPNMMLVANATNKLNGPYAATTGLDCIPGCGHYLWVANFGNNTVTAYAIPLSPTSAPVRLFKAKPTCPGVISQPVGIAHAKGLLFITNTVVPGSITVWRSKANGKKCPIQTIAGSMTQMASPHGPSVGFPDNPNQNYLFTANQSAMTAFGQLANGNVTPSLVWSLPGTSTQGTATDWNLGNVWLTTNATMSYPVDAVWLCTSLPLPSSCPGVPAITGNLTGLNLPGLPSVSEALGTVFVPNINGGTVTEYPESGSGNIPPVATFTGLTFPYGTALENSPD
jgi:hypothetical protein